MLPTPSRPNGVTTKSKESKSENPQIEGSHEDLGCLFLGSVNPKIADIISDICTGTIGDKPEDFGVLRSLTRKERRELAHGLMVAIPSFPPEDTPTPRQLDSIEKILNFIQANSQSSQIVSRYSGDLLDLLGALSRTREKNPTSLLKTEFGISDIRQRIQSTVVSILDQLPAFHIHSTESSEIKKVCAGKEYCLAHLISSPGSGSDVIHFATKCLNCLEGPIKNDAIIDFMGRLIGALERGSISIASFLLITQSVKDETAAALLSKFLTNCEENSELSQLERDRIKIASAFLIEHTYEKVLELMHSNWHNERPNLVSMLSTFARTSEYSDEINRDQPQQMKFLAELEFYFSEALRNSLERALLEIIREDREDEEFWNAISALSGLAIEDDTLRFLYGLLEGELSEDDDSRIGEAIDLIRQRRLDQKKPDYLDLTE